MENIPIYHLSLVSSIYWVIFNKLSYNLLIPNTAKWEIMILNVFHNTCLLVEWESSDYSYIIGTAVIKKLKKRKKINQLSRQ